MLRLILIMILMVTMLLKVAALLHNPALLNEADKVFPLTLRGLLVVGVVAEVFCVVGVWISRTAARASLVILLFVIPASLYRLAGTFYGAAHCPCLGSLSGWWPWLAAHETAVLNTIAAWMSLSALLVLARNPVQRKSSEGVVAA